MGEIKKIKCVIWDLDNTLWDGILLEDENVTLRNNVVSVIKELDRRGILNSIASKNNYENAMEKLRSFGIDQYFLVPQISFNSKSSAVTQIGTLLNLGTDSFAFIDDQEFELEEVAFVHPEVMCIPESRISEILNLSRFIPDFITEDSARRREMYQQNLMRQQLEEKYEGPQQDFLKSLNMVLHVKIAQEEDLKRAEELVVRTNQLNSTGITYGYDELLAFSKDPSYQLFVCELEDRFGSYGKIGLTLIKVEEEIYDVKLLLFSCRVMSRGVGNAFLSYLILKAQKDKKKLRADFVETGRNKMMYVTYKMAGFQEVEKTDEKRTLEYKGDYSCVIPDYLSLREEFDFE